MNPVRKKIQIHQKVADTESDSADDNEQDGIEAQAASFPDLAVLNLSPKNYEDADTLPLSTQIPFSFQVGNYGSINEQI